VRKHFATNQTSFHIRKLTRNKFQQATIQK
jgi:hypothetical protein